MCSKGEVEAKVRQVGDARLVAEAVKVVYAYRPLRGELVCAIVNLRLGTELADVELLDRLVDAGFIYPLPLPEAGNVAYILGDMGNCYVRWKLGRKREPESLVAMYERPYSRLRHDTLAGDVMARLLLDIEAIGGELDWRGGWNSPDRGNRYGARWDAYGRLGFYGLSYSFVLEMDCGSEENPKFGEKVDKYRRYMAGGTWQAALGCGAVLPILTVTTGGETRMANMREAVRDWLDYLSVTDQQWYFTNILRLSRAAAAGDCNPLVAPVWDAADGSMLCASVLPYSALLPRVLAAAQQMLHTFDRATTTEQQPMLAQMQRMQIAIARLQMLA